MARKANLALAKQKQARMVEMSKRIDADQEAARVSVLQHHAKEEEKSKSWW